MTTSSDRLDVAVVGTAEFAERVEGTPAETGVALSASASSPEALRGGDTDADCVLCDQRTARESWPSLLAAITDHRPDLPVVVLVDDPLDETIATAIQAGADEWLPRSLWSDQPGTVAARLADLGHSAAGDVGDAAHAAREFDEQRYPADERFQLVVENVAEVIYIANEDFSAVEYVNPAYEDIWGRPVADLYDDATAFIEGIHPADRDGFLAEFQSMREDIRRDETTEQYEYEFRVQRPDGEVRWVLATGYPVERTDGANRFVGLVEDVTERRELERTYRDLFEGVSDGLVVHEPESGEIIDVNERYCEITGFDREELVGSNIRLIVSDDADDSYETARARIDTARAEGPQLFEFEAVRKDGERWVGEVHLRTIEIRGEEQVLASVRDVTTRTRRERAIAELQEATARMQEATSAERVAEIAVETAADALDLPAAACWFSDPEDERLVPAAATDPVHQEGLLSPLSSDRYEYQVFEDGDVTTYAPQDVNPDNPLETATLLPLGDHGLVAAGRPDERDYDEVTITIARTLADHTVTALDRISREREVRESQHRLEAILDRIDEAIFLAPVSELDESQPAPDYVSSGYATIWGQPLEGIQETYDEGFFGTLHPGDAEEYRALIERIVSDVTGGDARDRYSMEYRIERPDGEVRWVNSDFYPTAWRDDVPRIVIVSRDVTDRKTRERTIESFHDATAELTTTETVTDAATVAVEAAADVFDIPATAVYHYDEETTALAPAATGPALPAPGDLRPVSAGDSPGWTSFVDGTMESVRVDGDDPLAVDAGTSVMLYPLGGNGLLAVWRSDETVDTEAASILAATLEAALNRIQGERRLASRRAELQEQTERARRLDAITEVTQRVEAAITTQSSRRGMFDAVCGELVEVDPIQGAWIAAAEVGTDRLTPRTVAGLDYDHAERALGGEPREQPDPHPAIEAWESGNPRVVSDLVGSGGRSDWRKLLLRDGAGSVCALPLTHSGITYGVLVVVGDDPDAFGEREVDVLGQLGSSIGYAVSAIDRRRALESDDTLELEFHGSEMDLPFARLARATGARVRHERTIRRQDASVSVYYSVSEDVPDDVDDIADDVLPGDVDIVSRDEAETVVERRGGSWFGSVVSEYGGILRRGLATGDGVELVVELPQQTETRTIVERLQAAFPALDLVAQRRHRETETTPGAVQTRLDKQLTDRQREALETAHAMGYFDWPRDSSGEAVADRLDITQPTVNKHIRLGERKVFDLLFGPGGGSNR